MANFRFLYSLLLLACFILFTQSKIDAQAIRRFNSKLEWRSIQTEHFWIHYHQELAHIAQRLAPLAEEIHKELSKKLNWQPYWRTDIVLTDNVDRANGFATPFPYNKVNLYAVRPDMASTLSYFKDWLRVLLVHEYISYTFH